MLQGLWPVSAVLSREGQPQKVTPVPRNKKPAPAIRSGKRDTSARVARKEASLTQSARAQKSEMFSEGQAGCQLKAYQSHAGIFPIKSFFSTRKYPKPQLLI